MYSARNARACVVVAFDNSRCMQVCADLLHQNYQALRASTTASTTCTTHNAPSVTITTTATLPPPHQATPVPDDDGIVILASPDTSASSTNLSQTIDFTPEFATSPVLATSASPPVYLHATELVHQHGDSNLIDSAGDLMQVDDAPPGEPISTTTPGGDRCSATSTTAASSQVMRTKKASKSNDRQLLETTYDLLCYLVNNEIKYDCSRRSTGGGGGAVMSLADR
jgi:hypothetical protein